MTWSPGAISITYEMEKTKRILKLIVTWPIIIICLILVFIFGTIACTLCGGFLITKEAINNIKWERYKYSTRDDAQAGAEINESN